MTPHSLDDLIRRRLADLPPPPARGWAELQQQLDAAAAPPQPAGTADEVVAEKLTALAPVLPAGSWAAFEQKLTAAELSTTSEVDQLVSAGLERSAPARVSGWALLAARLDTIGKRREMVGCMKVAEVAFLLSMLLLYVQFGTPTAPRSEQQLAQNKPDLSTQVDLLAATPPALPLSITAPPTRSTAADARHALRSRTAVAPLSVVIPTRLPESAAPRLAAAALPKRTTTSPNLTGPVDRTAFSVKHWSTGVKPALALPLPDAGEPIRYYLNVFVSPLDLNQVKTLANPGLGIEAGTLLSRDWSLGTLVDITKGKNGIQVGLIYGNRSYVPAEILVLEDRRRRRQEDPDRVRFGRLLYNTVSIPLNYERVIRRTDDWQVSVGVGLSANVVLASEFRLAADFTYDDLRKQADLYRQELFLAGKLTKSSGLQKGFNDFVDPPTGYLQGGSLLDNTSLYLSGNIRIERLLDNRWSLYFSPTVSRLFTLREDDGGKGPLQDRIHNTMLRVGTRFRLTDK
ncbi:hypothetical protein [Neolewinella sp.]|uniref:hypothetical protein n=1 Tax=Neolewinella sp. TaxID=2993543 RepID=UPI003B52DCD4